MARQQGRGVGQRKDDVAQYSVIVFRMEQGEWKLDDVSVRRSAASPAAAAPGHAPAPRTLPPLGTAALSGDAQSKESQAILRAWESGHPDPLRRLDAPRL